MFGRCAGWVVVLLVMMGAAWAEEGLYQVSGIEVLVPNTTRGDIRGTGLAMAKREGLARLWQRVLTANDQAAKRTVLEQLQANPDPYIVQAAIVGEKTRAAGLLMTVDITFSDQVLSMLSAQGIQHNATPFPPLLVLPTVNGQWRGDDPGGEFTTGWSQSAAALGLTVQFVLGDVDDMINLSERPLAPAPPEIMNWIASRYGATQLLLVESGVTPAGGGVAAQATAVSKSGPGRTVTGRVQGGSVSGQGAKSELQRRLADQLLGQLKEQWNLEHLVSPALRHRVELQVVHDSDLLKFSGFIAKLRKLSGVGGLEFLELGARVTRVAFDYQDRNEQLTAALNSLGGSVQPAGEGWVVKLP